MAQTIVTAARDTASILSNKRVIDMSNVIANLNPSAAPFTVMLMKLRKLVCNSPKFEWLEDDLQQKWDAINCVAGYASGITDIVVDNSEYFTVGDIVKVPRTGECLRVTVVTTATDTLTVLRAFGETSAAAIIDNDVLVIIGNANAEGADTPNLTSIQESANYNYTQIFRTAVGATETEKASETYGGNDLDYTRAKKGKEHRIDIERAFKFGERKEYTTSTKPVRTTRGILASISTNVTNVDGALTKAALDSFCETAFQYGSDTKVCLASGLMLTAISTIAGESIQTHSGEETFGLAIKEYITPHGTLNLVHDKGLESSYNGTGIVIDLENVKYRFLKGRDTKLKTNVQGNGEDQQIDEYITEAGLQVSLEKTHAYIKGITGA